jgi:hypothetical protein
MLVWKSTRWRLDKRNTVEILRDMTLLKTMTDMYLGQYLTMAVEGTGFISMSKGWRCNHRGRSWARVEQLHILSSRVGMHENHCLTNPKTLNFASINYYHWDTVWVLMERNEWREPGPEIHLPHSLELSQTKTYNTCHSRNAYLPAIPVYVGWVKWISLSRIHFSHREHPQSMIRQFYKCFAKKVLIILYARKYSSNACWLLKSALLCC